jgi:hypothetical protein
MPNQTDVAAQRIIEFLSPPLPSELIKAVHWLHRLPEEAIRHAMWRLISQNVLVIGDQGRLVFHPEALPQQACANPHHGRPSGLVAKIAAEAGAGGVNMADMATRVGVKLDCQWMHDVAADIKCLTELGVLTTNDQDLIVATPLTETFLVGARIQGRPVG